MPYVCLLRPGRALGEVQTPVCLPHWRQLSLALRAQDPSGNIFVVDLVPLGPLQWLGSAILSSSLSPLPLFIHQYPVAVRQHLRVQVELMVLINMGKGATLV